MALLVDEGKLAWDDPVKKHLPAFELGEPYLTENTTLRDLLSHRVGLETGDIVARRGDLPRAEILGRLKYLQPYSPFRGKFKYSNLMYVAAGEAVAQRSGETWEDFVDAAAARAAGHADHGGEFRGPAGCESAPPPTAFTMANFRR